MSECNCGNCRFLSDRQFVMVNLPSGILVQMYYCFVHEFFCEKEWHCSRWDSKHIITSKLKVKVVHRSKRL